MTLFIASLPFIASFYCLFYCLYFMTLYDSPVGGLVVEPLAKSFMTLAMTLFIAKCVTNFLFESTLLFSQIVWIFKDVFFQVDNFILS